MRLLSTRARQLMNLAGKASPLVMVKHFGVSLNQAQRVQALLRLGVNEEDVRVAERLMRSRTDGAAIQNNNVSVLTPLNSLTERNSTVVAARRGYVHFMSLRGEKSVRRNYCCT